MTQNDTLLLNALQELRDGQKAIHDKLDAAVGEQAKMRERIAMLEAQLPRCVSYKQLVTWMLTGAGGGGTLVVGAYHFITTMGG